MKNKLGARTVLVRLLVITVAVTATFLLVLLALASANTEFFDRYYGLLYTANVAVALIFMLVVGILAGLIVVRLRQGRFGTRLLAKLAIFFALVGVLPGGIIYLVSLQFVSRSIESWFDVNVETALDSGLALGRGMLDNSILDLRAKGKAMADQLASAGEANTTLTLLRLRDQFNIAQASVVSRPTLHHGMQQGVTVLAQASSTLQQPLQDDQPTARMLMTAAGDRGYYASAEGEPDGNDPAALRMRVLIRIPYYDAQLQGDERYLQLLQPVPPALARNAEAVQRAYREYQEKALGRTGLRKMYIGTLTLALFLATFIGIILALALGNQLARPLFLLARGTEEVARGDLTPKREIKSNDELGFLTQMFNAMTRQLLEARGAVEANRVALEQSKAYLESILANLTAGVFVFDWRFNLTMANPGADRIFRLPFQGQMNRPLQEIDALTDFGAMVRKAFADRDAANREGEADREPHDAGDPRGTAGHWQQQFAIPVAGESEPLTLLVRGTRLFGPMGSSGVAGDVDTGAAAIQTQSEGAKTVDASLSDLTAGYVVVFDDISDVISAQRSVAWGEVARRLAHEIKNPLTPIQLSAERLQMKLSPKLQGADAEMLRKGATTIVNQVAAMKRMVDDFREYARTPPAVLQQLQLNELVGEVMTLYGVEDGKSPISVVLENLPVIKGDATQLRQVIHNLLQNAQDSVAEVEHPQVSIETRAVEYGERRPDGTRPRAVRLSVSDNGPGFPARILTRAFEPYVTTKAKGTGLGLAMVKKIVDEHGARIDIRNRSRHGHEGVAGAQVSIIFLQLATEEDDVRVALDAAVALASPGSSNDRAQASERGSELNEASQATVVAQTRVG